MATTTLTAPDIHCDGCANSIKRALGRVPGIETIDVNIETKVVTVNHEPTVTRETIVDKLDKAGFPVA